MDLDLKDRLFLYNQYEILKALDPEESEVYKVMQSIVTNGFKHNYDELITGFDDETPVSTSVFVYDVLQMYRVLNFSYDELSMEEKKHIDKRDITYAGFDGNEEGSYYTYANFILKELGSFEETYNNGKVELNSHTNMVDKYTRMVATWKEEAGRYDNLSFESIKSIIKSKYNFKDSLI